MQCFCKNEHKSGKKSTEIYKLNQNGTTVEIPICYKIYKDKIIQQIASSSISVIIVIVNVILKTIIIKMVYAIGDETISKQKATITNAVFLAQFANTGFVILLVNANLTEHYPHELTKYF